MPAPSETIRFSPFTPADAHEMTHPLAESFTRGDPPAIAVGLTLPEFEALVRLICPKATAESLTIVARSAETGEMCGALLAEDSASPHPDGIEELSEKFHPAGKTKEPIVRCVGSRLGWGVPFQGLFSSLNR